MNVTERLDRDLRRMEVLARLDALRHAAAGRGRSAARATVGGRGWDSPTLVRGSTGSRQRTA